MTPDALDIIIDRLLLALRKMPEHDFDWCEHDKLAQCTELRRRLGSLGMNDEIDPAISEEIRRHGWPTRRDHLA